MCVLSDGMEHRRERDDIHDTSGRDFFNPPNYAQSANMTEDRPRVKTVMGRLRNVFVRLQLPGEDSDKGYVEVDYKRHTGYIEGLLVYKRDNIDYRLKGYGKRLVQVAEDFLRSKGCTEVVLQARPEAKPFWKKMGYTPRSGDYYYFKHL